MANRLTRDDKLRILKAVYKRDGKYWYCGMSLLELRDLPKVSNSGRLPLQYPTLDHIIPAALGGPNNKKNMRASCQKCNSTKAHRAVFSKMPQSVEACHKLIEDMANDLITQEVKMRERTGQLKNIQRRYNELKTTHSRLASVRQQLGDL